MTLVFCIWFAVGVFSVLLWGTQTMAGVWIGLAMAHTAVTVASYHTSDRQLKTYISNFRHKNEFYFVLAMIAVALIAAAWSLAIITLLCSLIISVNRQICSK